MLMQSLNLLNTVCSSFPSQYHNHRPPSTTTATAASSSYSTKHSSQHEGDHHHHHHSLLLRFRRSQRQNIQQLKSLGVIAKEGKPPSPETIARILSVVDFLKAKGFSDSQFPRLSFLCPNIFSSSTDITPVFFFLSDDLVASPQESNALVLRCPQLLLSSVDFQLRPTLLFLRQLGLRNLSSPTSLNAHLLNTPVHKLLQKIHFLEVLGISREDSSRICARLPAIFGYSIENNLRPKVDFLIGEMDRTVEELKEFPQYFAFSLERRIIPRHLHLKEKGVRITLQRMLLWSDRRFYTKWK